MRFFAFLVDRAGSTMWHFAGVSFPGMFTFNPTWALGVLGQCANTHQRHRTAILLHAVMALHTSK